MVYRTSIYRKCIAIRYFNISKTSMRYPPLPLRHPKTHDARVVRRRHPHHAPTAHAHLLPPKPSRSKRALCPTLFARAYPTIRAPPRTPFRFARSRRPCDNTKISGHLRQQTLTRRRPPSLLYPGLLYAPRLGGINLPPSPLPLHFLVPELCNTHIPLPSPPPTSTPVAYPRYVLYDLPDLQVDNVCRVGSVCAQLLRACVPGWNLYGLLHGISQGISKRSTTVDHDLSKVRNLQTRDLYDLDRHLSNVCNL